MVDLKLELPNEFFEEEIRDGYLVTSEMKKVWAVELDLLNEFMRVCKKHDICFFSDAGTTIGAIRHGGFIPWDDDIDIFMKREDFVKLELVASEEFSYPYFWQTEETDPGSARNHAQLRNSQTTGILDVERQEKYQFNQGIFIDIFPMDYMPDNEKERKKYFSKLAWKKKKMVYYLYSTIRFQIKGRNLKQFLKYILHFVLSVSVSKEKQYKIFKKMYDDFETSIQQYDKIKTNTVGNLFVQPVRSSLIWKAEWIDSTIEYPFEMLKVPVPVGYDNILRQQYGEWMIPVHAPSSHGGVFFDTDRSYMEYIH